MALTDGKSYLFIHIYKTGGMSLRKTLYEQTDCVELLGSHSTALQIQNLMELVHPELREVEYNDLFKFSFVRNPFDWLVSLYEFVRNSPSHELHEEVCKLYFEQFLRWNMKQLIEQRVTDTGKFSTQSAFVTGSNGRLIVDYVGRHENYEVDYNYVMTRLGINNEGIVPKINVIGNSQKQHLNYRSYYYKPEMIKMVYEHYQEDFENFGYQF
jgi:hypothetical protein